MKKNSFLEFKLGMSSFLKNTSFMFIFSTQTLYHHVIIDALGYCRRVGGQAAPGFYTSSCSAASVLDIEPGRLLCQITIASHLLMSLLQI